MVSVRSAQQAEAISFSCASRTMTRRRVLSRRLRLLDLLPPWPAIRRSFVASNECRLTPLRSSQEIELNVEDIDEAPIAPEVELS